jgi:hypothetical protein
MTKLARLDALLRRDSPAREGRDPEASGRGLGHRPAAVEHRRAPSRDQRPRKERQPPEGVHVAYAIGARPDLAGRSREGGVSRSYALAASSRASISEPTQVSPIPELYEYLEAEAIKYAIRLPANRILQRRISYLLTRPVGRPPNEVRRSFANFTYQAGSWTKARRVVAKVEWHPGELYPRIGFIVTNMARPAENVVPFYNRRGTCEQWIKGGQGRDQMDAAVMPLVRGQRSPPSASCARLQSRQFPSHAGDAGAHQGLSLTSLKEKLIKIGAKVVSHGRYELPYLALENS